MVRTIKNAIADISEVVEEMYLQEIKETRAALEGLVAAFDAGHAPPPEAWDEAHKVLEKWREDAESAHEAIEGQAPNTLTR
jgi:hypothetical protein